MKQIILSAACFLSAIYLFAQPGKAKKEAKSPQPKEIKVPMEPAYWEYDSSAAEFVTYKNTRAIKSKNGRGFRATAKNQVFANGTIEFDVELIGRGFPGIDFRVSEDRKTSENFYIRAFGPVPPEIRTTLQYAAVIDGNSMWDLTDEYQSGANINQDSWNHVKLVISGKQMKAYVNDMNKPALIVPELECWRDSGGIALIGNVIYANLIIKPNATEGLSPEAGYISTYNDTRYIRNWMVSPAKEFPFGKEVMLPLQRMDGKIVSSELPDSTTQWSPIKAESRALVNLSRIFKHKENEFRRIAWLKTTIQSDKEQERTLSLGFNDEVWVFINGQILYVDKNYFGTPEQKASRGRCTIENTSFKLPLKQGKNEIMIAVANYFYGWGIIARLDETDGIQLEK